MAFYNITGSLMRKTISQNSLSNTPLTGPSKLNAFRCLSTKLFIGGLPPTVDDRDLEEAFSGFGDVVDAKIVMDRDTGRSRGFGFVTYVSDKSATVAVTAMDGQEIEGRRLGVRYANQGPPPRAGDNNQ